MKKGKMQVIAVILCVVMMSVVMAGCNNQPAAPVTPPPSGNGDTPTTPIAPPADALLFKIAMTLNDSSPFYVGAVEFDKRVREKTDGAVGFEIYPSAVLGTDRDQIEGLTMGSVDMAIGGLSNTNSFVPETQVFSLPFLFADRAHVAKVLTGPVGDEIAAKFDSHGIEFMAYWENGFRLLSTSKYPVQSVSDLKGLKIRVMESPLHISIWSNLGTDPTPITWAELFTALQQGTVDGQENPLTLFTSAKFYEVQKNITMTNHVYEPAAVMFSQMTLKKATDEQQKIIIDTAKEVTEYEVAYCESMFATDKKTCEDNGVVFEENPDIESFRTAVAPVYDEFIAKYDWAAGYIEQIRNAQ